MGARPDLTEKNLSVPTTVSHAGSHLVSSPGANQKATAAGLSTTTELQTSNGNHLYQHDDRDRIDDISRSHPSLFGAKEFEAYPFPAVISGEQSDKPKAADLLDAAGSPANQLVDGTSPQRMQIGGFPYYLAASGHQSAAADYMSTIAEANISPENVGAPSAPDFIIAQQNAVGRSVAFIDPRVANYMELAATFDPSVEIVRLIDG